MEGWPFHLLHTDTSSGDGAMNIRVVNIAKKVERRGNYDWYDWQVYVDADDSTLAKIKEVEYLLHPTFPDRRRVVKDRASGFALNSAGWGGFTMLVTIHFTDGSDQTLTYFLDLSKPWKDR